MNVALAHKARAQVSPAAVPARRKKIGIAIAALADMLQVGMFEAFLPGALSLPDDALDLVVGALLMATLGFRWRLVFAMMLELTPGAALFPSWTAFVLSLPTLPEESPAAPLALAAPKENAR